MNLGVPKLVERSGHRLIWDLSGCDGVKEFVGDGTTVSAGFLEERVVRGRGVLSRPAVDIKFIYDIGVYMFAFARATRSRDISEAMGVLPRGSTLYADGEFFVRENCVKAFRRGIDFQVRPSRVFSCRILRRGRPGVSRPGGIAGKNGERGAAHNVRRMLMLEALAGLFVRIGGGGD